MHLDDVLAMDTGGDSSKLLFPAWRREGSTVGAAHTRLGRAARRRRLRRLTLCTSILLITIALMSWAWHWTCPPDLTASERVLLGVPTRPVRTGNPWRRRQWGTSTSVTDRRVIVRVAGCGGTIRRASRTGDTLRIRYLSTGSPSVSSATVTLGSGQAPRALEAALLGRCVGEVIRLQHYTVSYLTVYIAASQMNSKTETDRLDSLAKIVISKTSRKGRSCNAACTTHGLVCDTDALRIVNNCPRLRAAFPCAVCEVAPAGAAGPDMPAWVSTSAPAGHARGACLVAPPGRPPACAARYAHTRRLCGCVRSGMSASSAR